MAGKREKLEDIVSKLRQVEVLQGQGVTVARIAEAVRQIGVTQQGSVANFAECRHSLTCGQNYAASSAKAWNTVAPLAAI